MNITKDTVVTLTFRASDAQGKLLEDGKTPRSYLHGGYGNTLPGIEKALEGQAAGYQATVTLAPEDAFGERDESLKRTIPKGEFPAGVKVGGQLRGTNDQGLPQIYNVVKIKGQEVLLDGNHPLSGRALRLNCVVNEVREATPEEIEHRHVHGGHGHHH